MNQRPEPASRPPAAGARRPRIPGFLVLVLIFLSLAAGLTQLMRMRFQRGDIYPPYSTLRSDPLGARAYYESLKRLEGQLARDFTVSRNYQPLDRLGRETRASAGSSGATVLMLGMTHNKLLREKTFAELEELARGGRLVLAFFPIAQPPRWSTIFGGGGGEAPRTPREETAGEQDAQTRRRRQTEPRRRANEDEQNAPPWELATTATVSLERRWDFQFAYTRLPQQQAGSKEPGGSREPGGSLGKAWAERQAPVDLPEVVSWHSALCFSELGPEWRVLYAREGKPVIVERPLGQGSVVLATDSFLFSNEALRQEPQPRLLAWMVGDSSAVVFDETHLGVAEQRSVGALARKYRLHGLLAGLLILAGLFIWKNSTSLVPPVDEARTEERRALAAGRDFFSGLSGLLRRNISRSDILATCFQEWMKSLKDQPRQLSEKARRVEALVEAEQARPARQRNPVAAYRAACRLLRPGLHGEKRRGRGPRAAGEATPEPRKPRRQTKGENL